MIYDGQQIACSSLHDGFCVMPKKTQVYNCTGTSAELTLQVLACRLPCMMRTYHAHCQIMHAVIHNKDKPDHLCTTLEPAETLS